MPAASSTAASAWSAASLPPGKRPMSKMPCRGVAKAATSPGAEKLAGIITVTPCTFGNRLSAIRSFATPFCTQKTGCPATPAARSRSSAGSGVLGLHRSKGPRRPAASRSRRDRPRRGSSRAPPRPASAAAARRSRIAASWAPAGDADDLLPRQRQRRRHRSADRSDAVDDGPHHVCPGSPRRRATLANSRPPSSAITRGALSPSVAAIAQTHLRPQRMAHRHRRMLEVARRIGPHPDPPHHRQRRAWPASVKATISSSPSTREPVVDPAPRRLGGVALPPVRAAAAASRSRRRGRTAPPSRSATARPCRRRRRRSAARPPPSRSRPPASAR